MFRVRASHADDVARMDAGNGSGLRDEHAHGQSAPAWMANLAAVLPMLLLTMAGGSAADRLISEKFFSRLSMPNALAISSGS